MLTENCYLHTLHTNKEILKLVPIRSDADNILLDIKYYQQLI